MYGRTAVRVCLYGHSAVYGCIAVRPYDCTVVRLYGCTAVQSVRPYGRTAGRQYGCTAVRLYGRTAVRLYGCRPMYGSRAIRSYGRTTVLSFSCIAARPYGCTAVWLYGCMAVQSVNAKLRPVSGNILILFRSECVKNATARHSDEVWSVRVSEHTSKKTGRLFLVFGFQFAVVSFQFTGFSLLFLLSESCRMCKQRRGPHFVNAKLSPVSGNVLILVRSECVNKS